MKQTWKKYIIRAEFHSKVGTIYRNFETWKDYYNYVNRYKNLRTVVVGRVRRI